MVESEEKLVAKVSDVVTLAGNEKVFLCTHSIHVRRSRFLKQTINRH